jgi:hypothetical protein
LKKVKNPLMFHEGMLVYLLSPSHSSLQTNSRKIRLDFIGPLAIKSMLDRNHAILQTIEGQQINGVFHVARLKLAWIKTDKGVVNDITDLRKSAKALHNDDKTPDMTLNLTIQGEPINLDSHCKHAIENDGLAAPNLLSDQMKTKMFTRIMELSQDSLELDILRARYKDGSLQLLIRSPVQDYENLWMNTGDHPNLFAWIKTLEGNPQFRITGSIRRFVHSFLAL